MRLLFITSTRIGDAVLSTGLLGHLLERHPGARVTVACGPLSAPLFAAVPGLERVVALRKRRWHLHWLLLWSELVRRRWDLVVDLRGSAIGFLVLRARRVGFWRHDRRSHRVVEHGGVLGLDPPPAPRVWLAPEHEAAAERLLGPERPVLALGPAANGRGKTWPAERFVALAERLTAPGGALAGARIAVLAAAQERDQTRPVIEGLGRARCIDLTGRVGLLEAAACLRRAALCVGNDSGLMHLAAASGAPTLGLFGPSPETRYAPWGPHCAFVRTDDSFEDLEAAPDYRERWEAGRLMDGLPLERALAAAEALLSRLGVRSGETMERGSDEGRKVL